MRFARRVSLTLAMGCCCGVVLTCWASERTSAEEDQAWMVWGAATNSIRAGVLCSTTNKQVFVTLNAKPLSNMAYLVVGHVAAAGTAIYAYSRQQDCEFSLTNEQGKPVPINTRVVPRKEPFAPPAGVHVSRWKTAGFSKWIIPAGYNSVWAELRVADYFRIEKRGIYKLTYVQHVLLADTNHILRAVCLPPVVVDVAVSTAEE